MLRSSYNDLDNVLSRRPYFMVQGSGGKNLQILKLQKGMTMKCDCGAAQISFYL